MELDQRVQEAHHHRREKKRGVNCHQFEGLIAPFLHNQLKEEQTRSFLDHVASCADCYEELKLTFTIEKAIMQLDTEAEDDFSNVDLELGQLLEKARRSCAAVRRKRIALKMVLFLAELAVAAAVVWYILH